MIVTLLLLIARNIAMLLVAVSFTGLSVCSSSMALSPIGVAALSMPSMLAERFMSIAPCAGWPSGTSGKQPAHQWAQQPRKRIDQAGVLGNIHHAQPQRHDADQADANRDRRLRRIEQGHD